MVSLYFTVMPVVAKTRSDHRIDSVQDLMALAAPVSSLVTYTNGLMVSTGAVKEVALDPSGVPVPGVGSRRFVQTS